MNTRKLNRIEFLIFSILLFAFVLYGLFLAFGSYTGFPTGINTGCKMPYLADKPVGEDGYYMLTIAWNFAEGKGLVYNGNEKTTGIQPLGTLIYAGFARMVQLLGGDKWAFVKLILILGVFILLIFAHIVGKIACDLYPNSDQTRQWAYVLAVLATVFNFSVFRGFTYGLETGIYLILIALNIRLTLKRTALADWDISRAIRFGLLIGLTILARIDFSIIILIFICLLLIYRRIKLIQAGAASIAAFIIVSPWFIWVKSVSGHWLPSSGSAQAKLISANNAAPRVLSMVTSLLDHLTPWAFEASKKALIFVGLLSLAIFFLWLFKKKGVLKIFFVQKEKMTLLMYWTVGMGILIIIYIVFFWAQHFYGRYSAVILALIIPVLSALTILRIASMSRWIKIAALFILPVCFFAAAYFSFHTGSIGNSLTIAAGFIHKEFPPPIKVGSFQSGVIGYFNSNVINLDGKVNSNALSFLKNGEISKYIDREKIEVLVDWPSYIFGNLKIEYLKANWKLYNKPLFADMIRCYIRK